MLILNIKHNKQNLNLKYKGLFLLVLLLSFYLYFFNSESYAQKFSTGINPSVIKIEANAPSEVNTPLKLENTSDQTVSYSIFLRPFKANSELNGEPDFDPNLNDKYKEFFENVTISDQGKTINEITLTPNQRKNLKLTIQVSEDLEPRDYYFTALFLSQVATESSKRNEVKIRGGVASNILLTVGEKKEPIGRISNFTAPHFITNGPVSFDVELANLNDYFVTSKGNIIIKNVFGQAVGNIEIKPTNILANSNRIVSGSGNNLIWNEKFLLGIYKAELNVAISDKGPLLTETKTFIALPIMPILIIIFLVSLFFWLYKTARKRNLQG